MIQVEHGATAEVASVGDRLFAPGRPPTASAINAHVNPLVCRRYETFRIAGVYREPRVFGRKRADITPGRPPVATSQSPPVVYFVEGSLCVSGGDITELGSA